jgi:hypothetical protein
VVGCPVPVSTVYSPTLRASEVVTVPVRMPTVVIFPVFGIRKISAHLYPLADIAQRDEESACAQYLGLGINKACWVCICAAHGSVNSSQAYRIHHYCPGKV